MFNCWHYSKLRVQGVRNSRVNWFEILCRGGTYLLQGCLIRWLSPMLYPCHAPGRLASEMKETASWRRFREGSQSVLFHLCQSVLLFSFPFSSPSCSVSLVCFVLFSGKGSAHVLTQPQGPRPQVLTDLMSPTALFSWGLELTASPAFRRKRWALTTPCHRRPTSSKV